VHKRHEPARWTLYALVPLMGGLFALESRASLPPGWRKLVWAGIVLFIYGLVWLWVCDREAKYDGDTTDNPDRAESWSLGLYLTPRPTHVRSMRARHNTGRVNTKANGRKIRKCSLSLDRRSPRWPS
jgi:hypothetical protein